MSKDTHEAETFVLMSLTGPEGRTERQAGGGGDKPDRQRERKCWDLIAKFVEDHTLRSRIKMTLGSSRISDVDLEVLFFDPIDHVNRPCGIIILHGSLHVSMHYCKRQCTRIRIWLVHYVCSIHAAGIVDVYEYFASSS